MTREQIMETLAHRSAAFDGWDWDAEDTLNGNSIEEEHDRYRAWVRDMLSAIEALGYMVVPRDAIDTLSDTVSHTTINLVRDYNYVHLMMDEGKEWPAARNYLASNGWNLTTETYDYWLAFTQQKMILVLDSIVETSRKSMIEAWKV